MSPERSKLLWITVAVSAFVLVVAIVGVFFLYPKNQAPAAPATIGNTAAPKPPDPQDYRKALATAPTETKRNGDVIVIYGDKPQSVPPLGGSVDGSSGTPGSAANPSVTTTTTTTTTLPGTPVPADGSTLNQQPSASATPPSAAAPAVAPTAPTPAQQVPATPKTLTPSGQTGAATATKPSTKPKVVTTTTTAVKKPVAQKPAAKPETQYWIQTASFTERDKANNLRERLGGKGIAALIAVKDINGKSWYRVRVGPYSSSKEATGWLAKVKLVPGCNEAFVSTETGTSP